MSEYRYIKGTETQRESVEFEGLSHWLRRVVVMRVDVDMLLCGIAISTWAEFKDGYEKLEPQQKYDILKFVQAEREKIITATKVKSIESWRESGLGKLGEYFRVGDEVTEELVDYFMDLLPPTYMSSRMLQVGEPYSDEYDPDTGAWRETFTTFAKQDGKWRYVGECFYKQDINRVKKLDRLATALQKVEQEIRAQ